MKLHLPLGGFKAVFLFAIIFLGLREGFGQCPAAPAANPGTYLISGNSNTNYNVGAGQVLVIQSGTFKGDINNLDKNGKIYVYPGATFNPGNINNPAGRIINCGNAKIPSFDLPVMAATDSLFIQNYNVMTLTGTYNTNGNNSSWLNGLGAKMTFTQSVTNFRDVTFINNGYVLINGSFNTGAVTAPHRNNFVNHDSITVTGSITLDAAIQNDGFFFSKGDMTLNSGGNINNGCFFETDNAFNYSSTDTLFVTGLTWVDKAGGGNVAKFQGKYVKVLGNGFIQGSSFENNGTYFEGDGNLYFSGATKNQGGAAGAFGILSTASYHLNFYDATLTGAQYFDTQGNNPNAFVTKTAIPAKDNTFVPGTCSNIIKGDFCKLFGNKPNAGSDVTICSSATTTTLTSQPATRSWSVYTGAAGITPQTAAVTGMNTYSTYQFILTDNSNSARCSDTVKVSKIKPPTVAAGSDLTACASASPGAITLTGASFGGSASTAAWSIAAGGGTLSSSVQTNSPATVTYTPVANFSGTVTLTLSSNVPTNCTVATDSRNIVISPRPTAIITGTQTICSGTATSNISIDLTGTQPWSLTYSDGVSAPITVNGITSSPNTFTPSPVSTRTYVVTALNDSKCTAVAGDLAGGAVITVIPKPSATVTISATSPVCVSGTTTVTVNSSENGVTYSIFDNGTLLGTTAGTGSNASKVFALNSSGTRTISAKADITGCATVNITSTATVTVNPIPNSAITISATSPVCVAGNTTVTVNSSENGVTYSILDNGTLLGTIAGTGANVFKTFVLNTAGTRTISAKADIAGCATINLLSTASVVVNPLPSATVTISATSPVCVAGNTTVAVNASENGVTYSIFDNGTLLGTILGNGSTITKNFVLNNAGSRTISAKADIGGCSTVNILSTAAVVVNPPPSSSPTLTATGPICAGANSTITVNGSELGVTYQIYDNGTLIGTIPGTGGNASKSLTLNNAGIRTISAKATIGGCATVNLGSTTAVIVNPLPASTATISATSPVCVGNNTNVTITGSEVGVTYTINDNGSSLGTMVGTGGTMSKLFILNSSGSRTISASANIPGCGAVSLPSTASVTVNPIPSSSVTISATSPVCVAGNTTVTINASEIGVTYSIYDNGTLLGSILGTGSNVVKAFALSLLGTRVISAKADIAGCATVNLVSTANVIVNPLPNSSITISATSPVCVAGNTTVTINASENGVTYSVFDNGTLLGTIAGTGANASKAFTLNTSGSRTISAKADIGGCTTVNLTSTAIVIVNPLPKSTVILSSTSPVCINGNTTITINASEVGVTYSIFDNGTLLGTIAGTGGNVSKAFVMTIAGNRTISAKADIGGCTTINITSTANVVVNPVPSSTVTISATGPVCVGGSTTVTVNLSENGVTYSIFDNGVLLGTVAGTGANALKSFTLNTAGARIISAKADIGGCTTVNLVSTAGVVVNPLPSSAVTVSASSPVCVGGNTTVTINTSEPGVTYTIFDNGSLLGSIPGTGANASKSFALNTSGTRTISAKADIGGCATVNLTSTVDVIVNPVPNSAVILSSTSPVCVNGSTTVTINSSEVGVIYSIFDNGTLLGTIPGTGLNASTSFVLTASGTRTISAKADIGGCTTVNLASTASVVVNPLPNSNVTLLATSPLCINKNTTVTVNASENGVTYTVFDNGTLLGTIAGTGSNASKAFVMTTAGTRTISAKADIGGCATVNLTSTVSVIVVPDLVANFPVISDPTICSNAGTTTINITNAISGVKYVFSLSGVKIDSVTATSNSASIIIQIAKLNPVANIVSIRNLDVTGSIANCNSVVFTDPAKVTINPLPLSTVTTKGDTICTTDIDAKIVIQNAQGNVNYEVFTSGPVLATGTRATNGTLTILLPRAGNLNSGDNTVNIRAIFLPCSQVGLSPVNVKVNPLPSATSSISSTPPVVCAGGLIKVSIGTSTAEATYRIYDDGVLTDSILSIGGNITKQVNMNTVGLRIITVKAFIKGCGIVDLINKDTVTVLNGNNINIPVTATDTVCIGNPVTVTVQNTELLVDYQVFENAAFLSTVKPGTGGTITYTVNGLAVGSHFLKVTATTVCGPVDLKNKPIVIVNGIPTATLAVKGDTLCLPSTADSMVTIFAAQAGVTYKAFVAGQLAGQGKGTGANLKFAINRSKLSVGNNYIKFTATITGCTVVNLKDSANVRVNTPPNLGLQVISDTVCSMPVTNPVVKILSAEDQVKYTAFLNTILVGSGTGPQSSLGISIDNTKLSPGDNAIRFVATINGCPVANLLKTANARINIPANVNAVISNDTICTLGGANPRILVKNSELNVIYRTLKSGVEVGKGKGTGIDLAIDIDKTTLTPGDNPIVVEMTAFKCASGLVNRNIRVNTIPNSKLTVIDTTVCTNSPMSHVGIEGTTAGITYSAYENGVLKGSPKLSKGGRLNIPINLGNGKSELKTTQNIHNLIVKAFIPGCDTILEGDTAIIKINQLPSDSLTITGSSGCGDAKVAVANTTAGVSYQAFKGNTAVNTAVKSNGGLLVLSIPAANLGIGTHIINVSATIDGCAVVILKDTASVTVKEVPSGNLKVTGSTVCTNSPNSTVTVEGTKAGEVYQAYLNNVAVGDSVKSTKPNIVLILPVSKLGEGNNIINVRSRLPGCGETTLLDTGLVIINKRPDSTRTVSGSTVCSNSPSGQIYIDNSKATEVYKVYEGKVAKGIAKAGNGGRLEIDIPIGLTSNALDNKIEDHFLSVIALIPGCDTVKISQKGLIKISQQPDSNLVVTGSIGCGGTGDLTVSVSGTKNKEVYQAYLDTVKVGSPVTSTGGVVILRLPVNSLKVGKNIINVSAFIIGCANVKLKDTALVVVNTDLANDLTVIGDTVCSDSKTAFLTILQTKAGEKYIFELKGQPARKDTVSPGGSFKVPIPVNALTLGMNSLVLKSQNPGCGVALLTNPGLILVNGKPDNGLGLDGDIVCSNGSNAQVTIANTKKGETYYAYHKGSLVDSVLSNGNGIVFNIPVSALSVGINKINAKVYIKGCGTLDLKDTAQVLVNPKPSDSLSVTGDTVCIGNKIVSVTIEGTRFNERYQAYESGKMVGGEKLSAGGKLILNLPLGGSTGLGEGYHKIEIKSTIDSCTVVDLKDWADVLINTSPDSNLTVIGDIVCSNGDSATVQILGTKKGEIYKAKLNGSFVSRAVTSNGGEVTLRIPVNVLSPDTNLINIFARVLGAGCPDVILNNKAKVVLNGLPRASLSVSGDTVCSSGNQAFAKVKIFNTTKSVTYTAYSNGVMLGQPIVSKGDTVVISIPIGQLKPDLNIVNFIASIDSCANVNLTDSAFVIKNKLPVITSGVEGSIVCSNTPNATVTINKSELNAVYVARSGNVQIGSSIKGTGNDITILLPVNQLKPDTNIVSIDVSIKGCGTQTLAQKALVIVNPKPSADLNTEGDVVCETSPTAIVKIDLTQRNVAYQAYYKGKKIGSPMVSNGNTVNLSIPVSGLSGIENKISVKASINKCEDVDLKDTALVVVNKVPRAGSVKISGSSICPGDDGEITMSGGDANVVYNILVNDQTTPFSFNGQSPETKIIIPASYLPKYTNTVTLRANIPSCDPKDIGDGASIYVLSKRLKITGKTLLCDSSISDYKTDTILGALSYKWTVTDDAKIISPFDTTSSIKVRFGTRSPLISVVPMATKRTCPLAGDTIKVNIEPFVRGNGFVSSKDTVCLNAIDSVYAGGLTGVSSYKWIWSDSIDVLGITKRTKKDSIQYVKTGMVTLKAIAYSNCAVAYVDTIIKHVLVLSTPYVKANEYDITPMKGTVNIINLNGSGTSVTSGRDTISYKWYTDKSTPGQIINPTSLYDATIIPAGKETKVYLLASNINGYCPAKDSAIINLTFKLEIPNVFTPNGDGVHDRWEIKNINIFFSNCTVEVFNKWGSFVFKSAEGYAEPWDGTRNGEDLPVATYYYIVDLKDGNKPHTGSVTIIR